MKYQHRFRVNAPLASVSAFHQQPTSMGAITPPPVRVELHEAPASLKDGGRMDFTLWFGPLPVRWSAIIEDVSETGFSDRQLSGPFREWVHRHTFVRVDDQTTEVNDEISLEIRAHPFWGAVGLGFLASLPLLFGYRGWKTRRMLELGTG